MSKTTLKDIKNLIHQSKDKSKENHSINPKNEYSEIEKPLFIEEYKSHQVNELAASLTDVEEKSLKSQESVSKDINIQQHNLDTYLTHLISTSDNHVTNKHYIKREKQPHSPKYNKPSISSENEYLLKQVEGKLTIKELSKKLSIPISTLYRWAKINHYQAKNGKPDTLISNELCEKILNQLSTMSIADLAKKHDIPYHVLYYWIKKQGINAKKASVFPENIQQELREKCHTYSLKNLAKDYGLSKQTMRSRLKNIGCYSDGQDGFFIVDERTEEDIQSFYDKNGISKTAEKFHTTKTAIKSYLRKINRLK